MATAKQLLANKNNARKSTGPKSAAGKLKSSQNSIKHGLTSKQLIIGEKFGDKPMSDFGLIIFCLFIFGLIIMFWFMRLKTEIDQNEVRMSFLPFVKKRVNWKEIKNIEIVNYGFIGGWGIRLWTKYGTVYNTKGNKGLAIELLSGKKFLIGTQKETELNKIVENKAVGNTGYN